MDFNNYKLSKVAQIGMILGKYEVKKKLGKGAYGQVMLAQDVNKKEYAIKIIPLKRFSGLNSYMLEYLQGQINCLKSMNSPYVMKLHANEEDKDFKYMICEYCDGGDVINVQAKQPNKIFPLRKATQILSFVIRGLQCLHDSGYIHRDIKAQNILMKNQNGKEVYKLSDFGFTKKQKDINFTVLGTGAYMSPQIYNQESYGFQIDMWAFGVLFYFMLNMQFPFKPHLAPNSAKKSLQLKKVATDFSYKAFVGRSRKKLSENCTVDVEDLFKSIFNPNHKERINFHDIRSHPLFRKYFPQNQVSNLSKILYKTNKREIKNKKPLAQNECQTLNAATGYSGIFKKNKQFAAQTKIIQSQRYKVQFLKETLVQIQRNAGLSPPELLSFKYNIQKYVIMLLKHFQELLCQKQLVRRVPELKWSQFCKSAQFKTLKQDLQGDLKKCQFQIQNIYCDCEQVQREIASINGQFHNSFQKKVCAKQFQGPFKKSYRKSTIICYQHLLAKLKRQQNKGNLINYHLTLVTICHAFNKIFDDRQGFDAIFQDYFNTVDKNQDHINYLQLKSYLAQCTNGQLNSFTKAIINRYFGPET